MKNLAAALVKAQSELPAVHKNATAKVKTKTGADYSYGYVTLDALLAVVLPALNSNGIALIQAPTFLAETGGMVLKTVLAHGESGETFEAQAPLKTAGTPQDIGSEISYARRYAIMSLLGIAADADDDAQAASNRGGQAEATAARVESADGLTDDQPTDNGNPANVIVTFGKKHKDKPLGRIVISDRGYLEWMTGGDFEPKTPEQRRIVEAARSVLAGDSEVPF